MRWLWGFLGVVRALGIAGFLLALGHFAWLGLSAESKEPRCEVTRELSEPRPGTDVIASVQLKTCLAASGKSQWRVREVWLESARPQNSKGQRLLLTLKVRTADVLPPAISWTAGGLEIRDFSFDDILDWRRGRGAGIVPITYQATIHTRDGDKVERLP